MKGVVVHGGEAGYGAAIADAFRRAGDRVFVLDSKCAPIPPAGDWTDGSPLDVLVLATLAVHRAAFLDMDEDAFDDSLNVNLRSAFLVAQAGARRLVAEGRPGSILFLSSTGATVATAGLESYCAAKGALAALARAAALSLAPHGIRVNAVAPGTISTAATQDRLHADSAAMAQALSRTPLGRIGRPEELGEVAVFLASDTVSYITGQSILVDGGRTVLEGLV
jgi:NAD(P)-dependent dehydrogenase (short-subunit alcohol dehydrogenase family)